MAGASDDRSRLVTTLRKAAQRRRLGVFLDIDGTLVPAEPRALQRERAEARRLLARLARARVGCVALVTGRRCRAAIELLTPAGVHVVGLHGAEEQLAGQPSAHYAPRLRRWEQVARDFRRGVADAWLRRRGLRLEDKGCVLGVGGWALPDQPAAKRRLQPLIRSAQRVGLYPHWGRGWLELRPPETFDKGVAVERLVRASGADTVLAAGDDRGDLDMFAALDRLDDEASVATTVRLGVDSSGTPPDVLEQADVTVREPRRARELLARILPSAGEPGARSPL